MTKKTDYQKLLKLQNLTKKALEEDRLFLRENPYCGRLESHYAQNPVIIKQRMESLKLLKNLGIAADKFRAYRENLEHKYKFNFPVECYGYNTFAESFAGYFMNNIMR